MLLYGTTVNKEMQNKVGAQISTKFLRFHFLTSLLP